MVFISAISYNLDPGIHGAMVDRIIDVFRKEAEEVVGILKEWQFIETERKGNGKVTIRFLGLYGGGFFREAGRGFHNPLSHPSSIFIGDPS
ncbi:MAG: hypothetical protein HPY65_13535 [Syntrophaceae bacterium]|nr:hypothetical protein [Syntrophaceae bacterium]